MTGSSAAPEDEAPARDQQQQEAAQQPQETPRETAKVPDAAEAAEQETEEREEGEEPEEEEAPTLTAEKPTAKGAPTAGDTPAPRAEETPRATGTPAQTEERTPESRARRAKAGSFYERYLNIKQSEVNKTGGDSMQEISNSTGAFPFSP